MVRWKETNERRNDVDISWWIKNKIDSFSFEFEDIDERRFSSSASSSYFPNEKLFEDSADLMERDMSDCSIDRSSWNHSHLRFQFGEENWMKLDDDDQNLRRECIHWNWKLIEAIWMMMNWDSGALFLSSLLWLVNLRCCWPLFSLSVGLVIVRSELESASMSIRSASPWYDDNRPVYSSILAWQHGVSVRSAT